MKWKKGSSQDNENTRPHTCVPLYNNIYKLTTPLQFFSLFFTEELYEIFKKKQNYSLFK